MEITMPSWRDTLFLWDGELVVTPSKNKVKLQGPEETELSKARENKCMDNGDFENINVTGRVSWSGGWIGSPCPDARAVPVPLMSASRASDMKFSVNGTIKPTKVKRKEGIVILPINSAAKWQSPHVLSLCEGEGWDLCDDGSSEKTKHHDFVHDLFLYTFDAFSEEDFGKFKTLPVVGIGNNAYGHFVSAGFVHGRRLVLGRRYLAKGDIREKYGLEMLFSEIEKTFPDLIRYCSGVRCFSGFKPPWRSIALHSQLLPGKRKRGEPEPILAYMNAPKIDTSLCGGKEFEPLDLKVLSCRNGNRNATYICSPPKDVLWEEQCWSCGGHCQSSHTSISFTIHTFHQDDLDYSHYFLEVDFCNHKCAVNFVPSLVVASREFLRLNRSQGDFDCFLEFETEYSEFWEAIEKQSAARSKLEEVGWKIKELGGAGNNSMVLEASKIVN